MRWLPPARISLHSGRLESCRSYQTHHSIQRNKKTDSQKQTEKEKRNETNRTALQSGNVHQCTGRQNAGSRGKNKLEYSINAYSVDEAPTAAADADVILLGPQIRYKKNEVKKLFPDKPVDAIDMSTYGMLDGKKPSSSPAN